MGQAFGLGLLERLLFGLASVRGDRLGLLLVDDLQVAREGALEALLVPAVDVPVDDNFAAALRAAAIDVGVTHIRLPLKPWPITFSKRISSPRPRLLIVKL